MDILILKLILAPVIIGSTSLAGRKWGVAISGWLIGLPLTSGPVTFLLAISHNKTFAAEAARGVLSGGFSLIAFCLTYAWVARKFNWLVSTIAGVLVFAGMTALMQYLVVSLVPLFFYVLAVIFLGLWLMPSEEIIESDAIPSKWDIPARMLIGTSFILLVTGIAPYIGARLTGLLTTIPLYGGILTIFAHRHQGSAGAAHVLRGLVYGLFGFAGFYLVLGSLIEQNSLFVSFGAAILTTLVVQGASLWVLNRLHLQ